MFYPFLSSAEHLPYTKERKLGEKGIKIRYLGTAGFVIESRERTFVLDPYLSRPSISQTLFTRIKPKAELLLRELPRADDVLIGHAHHDHILDAPLLCQQTGARLIGSHDACNVGRAGGLPEEQLVETAGREWITCGGDQVYGAPSIHGRVYGRVPLPGEMTEPPPWPPFYWQLRHGLVLNWLVEVAGLRIMHIDSADFIAEEFEGHSCDLLCLCAIGRQHRPDYVEEAVKLLKPKYIIPCHWDLFFTPFEGPHYLLPGVDLEGMLQEIGASGVASLLLPIGATIEL